jgi:alpha-L-fucosidase
MSKQMKRNLIYKCLVCLPLLGTVTPVLAQNKEADKVKMEHAQIGIVEDAKSGYKHTTHPGAQWFPEAGLGMFIHWSISSIKQIDLSWPMMAGTQIG